MMGSGALDGSALFDPRGERAACGVGVLVDRHGRASAALLDAALDAVEKLAHRGAVGGDGESGDGAGVLVQVPDAAVRRWFAGVEVPAPGRYAIASVFTPRASAVRMEAIEAFDAAVRAAGLQVAAWRDVPVDDSACGERARRSMPHVAQALLTGFHPEGDADSRERHAWRARKRVEAAWRRRHWPEEEPAPYICSLSTRTVVYKGMLRCDQLRRFYADLRDPHFVTAIAVFHQRFSTNTTPAWRRAHPYRLIAHNGEINTLRGNRAQMQAREPVLRSPLWGAPPDWLSPVLDPDGTDSAMLDNALELLVRAGRPLPHAIMMLMPEAWENDEHMPAALRDFYRYHACLTEPWDGPAAVAFTAGVLAGAALDRNGLRPARVLETRDGWVLVASEDGLLDVPPARVALRDRLRPGQHLVVDTARGTMHYDRPARLQVAVQRPWGKWVDERLRRLDDVVSASASPTAEAAHPADLDALLPSLRAYGYSVEEVDAVVAPMARRAAEPVASMGNDTPLAALSGRPRLLFDFFRQLFAQVTNPPIDPIREARVMSLRTLLGPQGSLLEERPGAAAVLELDGPVLDRRQFAALCALDAPGLRVARLEMCFEPRVEALQPDLDALCQRAANAVEAGATIVVLEDARPQPSAAPLPSLLALSAVHQHLVRRGLRTRCSLVVSTGEARQVPHLCLLVGHGADAVHPWLLFDLVDALCAARQLADEPGEARARVVRALHRGLRKVMSKMGISTLAGYRGAQVFEAIGLHRDVVRRYFGELPARIDGIGLREIAAATLTRFEAALAPRLPDAPPLEDGGMHRWRRGGEHHIFGPRAIALLQHAVRTGRWEVFEAFARTVDEEGVRRAALRGLLALRPAANTVPLEEVEPATSIVRRFKTGAMSLGSLSPEAHQTLARAMNQLGARSNSGEGGEDPARYGDDRRSAIKQVASGRFGVTLEYLLAADELQIKISQGAKPGEGGQLPGHKVNAEIARLRHATPGVELISPPPHHDIYSIEDLAQLIYDLRCANPAARINVKLVSSFGVGTIAAGVAKAGADVILISGASGGTGAAPLSSIHCAGAPWELGLAEAQQALVAEGLRDRVRLEVDGQLKTGRDVVVGALLGAEEFGFGTAALVAAGCVLMRVCHLNTCPVGIATQDPALRRLFPGQPAHVVRFMLFVAEHVRRLMAKLGFRHFDDMVGRVDCLEPVTDRAGLPPHAHLLDVRPLLWQPPDAAPRRCVRPREPAAPTDHLDATIAEEVVDALRRGQRWHGRGAVRNEHRAVGTLLSSAVVRVAPTLPAGSVTWTLRGTAGQSFGAFLARGITLVLEGTANDGLGKGLSGGHIVVRPAEPAEVSPVVAGNVCLYGATAGAVFLRGGAGERFAVRNSGAVAVVEGVGDHGCEYMTGGTVVVLGPVGENFAAGMTGGRAYVYDVAGVVLRRLNPGHVEAGPLDEDDVEVVRALLKRHWHATHSPLAWTILSHWAHSLEVFVRVAPRSRQRAGRCADVETGGRRP